MSAHLLDAFVAVLLDAFVAVLVAVLGACSTTPPPEPVSLGTACVTDEDCGRDGLCRLDGSLGAPDETTCTIACSDEAPCPEGWACADLDEPVCRCEERRRERCNERDDDCDGAVDEGLGCRPPDAPDPDGCGEALDCFSVRAAPVEPIDVLFVLDDSGAIASSQNALLSELPRFIDAISTGDLDGDGVREIPALLGRLHVGVITTDMGTGGFEVATCTGRFGDDGVLLGAGDPSRSGCSPTYPSFFDFGDEPVEPEATEDLACVASVGTAGCGLEQTLEAPLKALTPSTSSLRFEADTVGHADGLNAGFLRSRSALLIVILTNEEDCSVADPSLYDPRSLEHDGDLNLRCWRFGAPELGLVHPIERFVDGLLATREDPTRLAVSAIVGIPEATSPARGARPDWDAILDHPDMREVLDPAMPSRLRPSCDRTGAAGERAIAHPPRRIVRTLQALDRAGAHATVQTLCRDDLGTAMDVTLDLLADATSPCFARTVDPTRCTLVETLPPGRTCADVPARTLREVVADTNGVAREVCTVAPRDDASTEGWEYVPNDPMCSALRPNRIHVSPISFEGAALRLECAR
jgi:hypothetical protein